MNCDVVSKWFWEVVLRAMLTCSIWPCTVWAKLGGDVDPHSPDTKHTPASLPQLLPPFLFAMPAYHLTPGSAVCGSLPAASGKGYGCQCHMPACPSHKHQCFAT